MAGLIVARKFTVFALFYFIFERNFQVQAPGGLYLEGRFTGESFTLRVGGGGGGLYLEGLLPGILRYVSIYGYIVAVQFVGDKHRFFQLRR